MAAKLRAEAAALEADKAQQLADAAEKAFRKFDTNQDGEISFAELKAGLEKVLKVIFLTFFKLGLCFDLTTCFCHLK